MIQFQIPAISCGHCVKAVTQAVQSVDAQAKVDVDLGSKQVKVESAAPREQLVQVLAEAGYPPA